MPFQAYYLNPEGALQKGLSEEEVRAAFEAEAGPSLGGHRGDHRRRWRFSGTNFQFSPSFHRRLCEHYILKFYKAPLG